MQIIKSSLALTFTIFLFAPFHLNAQKINADIAKASQDWHAAFENGTLDELHAWLREYRVDEVECVTPDVAGVARGKVMPASSSMLMTRCWSVISGCSRE